MIKITSTNDVIIVEGDELTRHYPNNGTLVIPKNSTIVLLDEKSEMVLFKSASNYDTLFTGILGSISIEDEIVTRENIIEKFNAISNVNVGGNVDLFEVVQSLPTENIKNNKVYLVLDSNGSEGNTYVEYLYVNGQWEELGKFKVNVDLSGYALKTDILSAKTDTRYTDYDVENPVLSGKTILLQNEVTDSRKYHTFGYDKTVSELVKATNHINVTRGYNNVPSMETDIESGISLNTTSNGFHNLSGSVTIPLDNYDAVTTILHYEVSYVERDSEGNVTGGSSSTDVVDVTYDPNTKVLSYPDVSFLFAQITRTDTNKELFGGNNDGYAYQENGRQCYSFEQHPLQEGGTLIWNPYYSDQYFWNYSVAIDVNSLKEVQVSTDNKPERLNDYIRYSNDVKAYILTDKNTTFKTINGEQILGEGNIVIEASADNVPTLQTTKEGTTSNYIYSSGIFDGYGVISDISNFITYSTDKASISTYKRYWGEESENSYQSWSINAATTSKAGLMSASDKTKLDGIDITTKQDTLVSGTNIKTINGTSLLGSGNIEVAANVDLSNYYTKTQTNELVNPKLEQVTLTQAEYDALSAKEENVLYIISDAEDIKFKTINGQQITGNGDITIDTNVDLTGYATKSELNAKQDVLVSGTNIKTVNGTSLLGSGNIEVSADLSSYYTKAEIDEMIGGASNTITEINNLVG